MNDLIATEAQSLSTMETADLRKRLSEELRLTADSLVRLAAIVRVLEERGEDLSDLKSGLAAYVIEIAHGRLIPEAVVKFANRKDILSMLANEVPIAEQHALISNPVPVSAIDRGQFITRSLSLGQLTPGERRIAFDHGQQRPIPEQRKLLIERQRRKAKTVSITALSAVNSLRIGDSVVTRGEVIEALAELSSESSIDFMLKPGNVASFPVSSELHAAVKEAAEQEGVTMQEIIRRVFRVSGF